jgi:hypothetical protein
MVLLEPGFVCGAVNPQGSDPVHLQYVLGSWQMQ